MGTPPDVIDMINKLVRASRQMFRETSYEPTSEEIATRLGMSPDQVCRLMKIAQKPINLQPGWPI